MTNHEQRDIFAASAGSMDAAELRQYAAQLQAASAQHQAEREDWEKSVRGRLVEAEAALVRLRETADRLRFEDDRTPEQREIIKLLDDVGSPLGYLIGFVEASL